MSRKRTILRNTISNIGMQIVSAGLPFLLLPYMLRYWGVETYGVLVLAYSVQTFVFFLNSAINMTLMKYVSEFQEVNDFDRLNSVVNIFWVVAFLNNLAVSLALIVIGGFHLDWLNVSPTLIPTARHVFFIMGACGIVAGLFSFMDGVMYGLQRIHQSNLFRSGEALATTATAICTILVKGSMEWYVFFICIVPIVSKGGQFFYLRALIPQLRFNVVRYFDVGQLKHFSKFSGFQIVNQVSELLMFNMQKLIIQKFMGAASLTMYEVANKPNLLFANFITLPLSAILPACSAAYARGDKAFLERMLIQGTRIYMVLVVPPMVAFIPAMNEFLTLWLGARFAPATHAAQFLLWALVVACPFKIFIHMMVGKGRVFEYGVTKFVYAVLSVPVSILLIKTFGIVGGVSVLFAYFLIVEAATNIYVMIKERVSPVHLLTHLAGIALLLAIEYVAVSVVVGMGFGHNWFQLIGLLAGGSALTIALALVFVLKREERALIGIPA